MPIALVVGPAVALIGIVSVFFVLRRKSVEKRSMYSARRSQIEHKVRAARQRTLAPHGRSEKAAETAAAAPSPFAPTQAAPVTSYQPSAYEPPPAAAPPPVKPQAGPQASPWEVGPTTPTQAPGPFGPPPAEPYQPAPFQPEPGFQPPPSEPGFQPPPSEPGFQPPPSEPAYQPAYEPPPSEPAFQPAPSEQPWTPAPAPSEPAVQVEPVKPAAAAAATAGWSVVGETKDVASDEPTGKKSKKSDTGSWTLASGVAPGAEQDEVVKKPSATVAIAQYAILVVGLIMILIGVLVMVANSHVT